MEKKVNGRPDLPDPKSCGRSRITNGNAVLRCDGRLFWVKRYKDIFSAHLSDLGGESNASEGEKAILKRVACLLVELETLEGKFAEQGEATPGQLELYQRCANSARRLLESVGLERRQKDITTLGSILREGCAV